MAVQFTELAEAVPAMATGMAIAAPAMAAVATARRGKDLERRTGLGMLKSFPLPRLRSELSDSGRKVALPPARSRSQADSPQAAAGREKISRDPREDGSSTPALQVLVAVIGGLD